MEKKGNERHIHGDGGAWCGGTWHDIEDCGDFLIPSKDGSACRWRGDKTRCAPCPRSRTRHSAAKPDGTYDIAIIGAGAIGSCIARELSKTTASVILLEAADDVTQGATKGNSGIVHAGYDDKPGSVRAKFCWPGNQMFPQLDKELRFGYQQNGSLVVACGEEDEKVLDELMERGRKNGVANLELIDSKRLHELEPSLGENCTKALRSPDAGTLIPYEYAIALAENAADNGVEVRIRRQVTGIQWNDDSLFEIEATHWEPAHVADSLQKAPFLKSKGLWIVIAIIAVVAMYLLESKLALTAVVLALWQYFASSKTSSSSNGDGANVAHIYHPSKGTVLRGKLVDVETIKARYIVNSAGLYADKIAQLLGDYSFTIKPRHGEYVLLHKNEGRRIGVGHTLFPTPHPFLGKGVLCQSTLWGNLILGPTARDALMWDEKSESYVDNPKVRDEPKESILQYILSKCTKLVPDLDPGQVIHTFSGARAKSTRGDWIIEPCPTYANAIYAASIDSPGIAGSPAIALEVVRLLEEAGAPVTKADADPLFNPHRAPLIVPKQKFGYKNASGSKLLLSKSPIEKYEGQANNLVCKCEKVTEGEVVEACHRSLPIDSTQGMRKRVRAGMGHCQGDPNNWCCEERVARIIARETGQPLSHIGRRPWPASSLLSQRWIDDEERDMFRQLAGKSISK